jgi:hypothetical protein
MVGPQNPTSLHVSAVAPLELLDPLAGASPGGLQDDTTRPREHAPPLLDRGTEQKQVLSPSSAQQTASVAIAAAEQLMSVLWVTPGCSLAGRSPPK